MEENKNRKLDLKKIISTVATVAALGTSFVIGNAVVMVTPVGAGLLVKACSGLGGLVMSHMLADKVQAYTAEKAEALAETVKETSEELKSAAEKIRNQETEEELAEEA